MARSLKPTIPAVRTNGTFGVTVSAVRLTQAADPLILRGRRWQLRCHRPSLLRHAYSIVAPNARGCRRFTVDHDSLMDVVPEAQPLPPDISQALVLRAQAGDRGATDQLFTSLYNELHRLARREVFRAGPHGMLSATTLLHEAYLDISRRDALAFADAGHFMAYAARAMRGLVIDRVRANGAQKRGGGLDITSLDTQVAGSCAEPEALETISAALDELALLEPDLAQVVDLKFFCGFSMAEIGVLKQVSERTVQRQWEKARLLLYRALNPP